MIAPPLAPPTSFDVVALAASAGGIYAYIDVVAALPADLPAAVVLVQHLDPRHRSLLAEILGRHTALSVRMAHAGDRLAPGTVTVAPSGRHLLVHRGGRLTLADTAPVHHVRPSADILFASVAEVYRERAVAVVLTGTGRDGAAGVQAIKAAGGRTLAQDEATSLYFGMPGAAIRTGCIDLVLPLGRIAPAVANLVRSGATG